VAEAAKLLVAAESPLLIADRLARTPAGLARLIELAELLQAAVISTQPNTLPPIAAGRMNFPNRHPLNQTLRGLGAIGAADVIVGLEISNIYGATHIFRDQLERTSTPATKNGVKLISITAGDLSVKSNYQDFQRYAETEVTIAADGEATLPALIEAVKRLITADRRRAFDARGRRWPMRAVRRSTARAAMRPTRGTRRRSARHDSRRKSGSRSGPKTGRSSTAT
jgi:thiamine pyrophosphate-dependent acetolactate synthase large subunit-like protein